MGVHCELAQSLRVKSSRWRYCARLSALMLCDALLSRMNYTYARWD